MSLPREILLHCFSFLNNITDISSASKVSKEWNEASKNRLNNIGLVHASKWGTLDEVKKFLDAGADIESKL